MSNVRLLTALATEIFNAEQFRHLTEVACSSPLDVEALREFDDSVPGPSLSRIADFRQNAPGTLGIPRWGITRCEVEDRDIFKPLHYCMVDFLSGDTEQVEWRTRDIVECSGAHLEGLVKRIGGARLMPFGDALMRKVKPRLDVVLWNQLISFKEVYNLAKHEYSHALGEHLFSVEEAVMTYFIARRLGLKLYAIAKLKTNWRFDEEMAFGH